ncbi:anhydro-N-acetylmuramic acid kinase, partial [Haliscomenobacter sp.]|uniref:anhydro-N-acetylmuramic acid kinase n=1 Tax=Haliscomenobacter sp. TaxID=2717303 RepID=UPI003364FF0B
LCALSGSGTQTQVELLQFATVPYGSWIKAEIRKVFAKREIDFQQLCLLNPHIGILHGQMVNACLQKWGIDAAEVDLVASHGQTVFHAPKTQHGQADYGNATLQIGDGDHVAVTTGIITLADFRMRHVAAGGEGAPLAVYGDYFVFAEAGQDRILLNMGGISNFTYLPGDLDASKVFTTDTGPGNTLLDAITRKFYPHLEYDEDGKIALAGQVHEPLLLALKDHPFFDAPFPKTTGPEVFNLSYLAAAQEKTNSSDLDAPDLLRTLVQFSADTIVAGIKRAIGDQTFAFFLSGGGAHNPALTGAIRAHFPGASFESTAVLGIPGDAKEAVLFAILANEAIAGGHTSFGGRHKVPSVVMGKICWPG